MSRPIRIGVLSSGSRGNAVYLEGREGALLVDAGLGAREILRRMDAVGASPSLVAAILLSHEHTDHVRGAGALARALRVPIAATGGTLQAVRLHRAVPLREVSPGRPFEAAGFEIHPFLLPHDAACPVGFVFAQDGVRIGLATDLGCATALVRQRLEGCDALVLESNHDERMLMEGPYPWFLKQRVRGRRGHLSNLDSASLLAELAGGGLQRVVLAHLSEVNNQPDLAAGAAAEALRGRRCQAALSVASASEPLPLAALDT